MNYFVNENIFTFNSGTEISAAKRVALFKSHGIPAKILTRHFNAQLAGDLNRVKLDYSDVLNMYDYFQDIVDVEPHEANIRHEPVIDKSRYSIDSLNPNESFLLEQGRKIAKVVIAPSTAGQIGTIEYNSAFGNKAAVDIWDRRGFISATEYFHPDGSQGAQLFYDRTGKPKMEISRMLVDGQLQPTLYKLLDYKDKTWRFETEDELFVFFMMELAAQEPSVFICDRPSQVPAVASVANAAGKWLCFHNSHMDKTGKTNEFTKFSLMLSASFDGIIVSTEAQAEALIASGIEKKIVVIPDSYAEEHQPQTHDKDSFIFSGRLSPEKGAEEVLKIFKEIHRKRPKAKLVFYSYSIPPETETELKESIKRNRLEAAVAFKGHYPLAAYEEMLGQATFLLSASDTEGFGMHILEAMSFGTPVIAYDVPYGPSLLIDDGVSGILQSKKNARKAAEAALAVLSDEATYEAMSRAAREKARGYSADKVWSTWETTQVQHPTLYVKEAEA